MTSHTSKDISQKVSELQTHSLEVIAGMVLELEAKVEELEGRVEDIKSELPQYDMIGGK